MAVPPLSEVNRNLFNTLIDHHIRFTLAKRRVQLTKIDWYRVTALVVRDMLVEKMLATRARFDRADAKKLYYLSLEFLIGRSLENNLFNLGLIGICRDFLAENGIDLQQLFDEEPDAALGNGGLGRLAACFLDSLATMDMPGYGYGINYEYGLFRQEIRGGYQIERPDAWQREISPWLVPRPHESCRIPVYGRVEHRFDRKGRYRPIWIDQRILIGMPHDLPIAGFGGRTVNFVRLYSASASDEFDMQIFNAGDYMKAVEQKMFSENISKVLYPSDSVAAGRELRLLQEYFFVACAVQDIVRGYFSRGEDFIDFPAKVAIQLNDTHPALTIAELMRFFVDEQDLEWETAWEITRNTVAYTNHTLMPEALERWPVSLLERVVPRHLQVIYEINRRFLGEVAAAWSDAPERAKRISIVQEGGDPQIHMANLAIVGSHSINGVSKLHSDLLKTRLVPDFFRLWPERFSNKTNGVTQRRWLLMANPGLAHLLDATIGGGWATNLELLGGVEKFADDAEFHKAFNAIKRANKERLARIVNRLAAVDVDPTAVFDVQAKRIHEYKRQLLMALGIVHHYLTLVDDGVEPSIPRAYFMAGKAAPGYWAAKMIIKLINNLADVINGDPKTRELIKVAFLPDYRVSLAEKIIPAADVSEQISTAGREASGTGNMKFAMNGALTIGTLDGANIEIRDAVGAENIFIFGLTAEKIEELTTLGAYHPREYYEADPRLRRVLDELASDRFCPNEPGLFRWVRDVLLNHDEYFLLADFGSYVDTQSEISTQYQNRQLWNKKAILNLSRIGYFSSDRAVAEYARDIWNLSQA
ncbi:MAG: glycogen/starch/alpha-glucan phosphorylase [Candidatus Binatus sp.]|uniref:glycogen/starch/alpha-glucan phosphorylase n=1 Tax=Candidatus Binatus sp. TaxID=2811406 RepID=UPI002727E22A|nr:glycogen/starch/alpha-glucan phosphorylase [Candidatus Binatus sp.]MDO8431481.1 glycogen/starch/alpha-glucan phosphorylase [Candidatus Binatus sp.]